MSDNKDNVILEKISNLNDILSRVERNNQDDHRTMKTEMAGLGNYQKTANNKLAKQEERISSNELKVGSMQDECKWVSENKNDISDSIKRGKAFLNKMSDVVFKLATTGVIVLLGLDKFI